MRKLIRIAMTVAMLGALAGINAPAASAHHEDESTAAHVDRPPKKEAPTPTTGACSVVGSVTTTPGVSNSGDHSHYVFGSTTLICAGAPAETGPYAVGASGATDGHDCVVPGNQPNPNNPDLGQDCNDTGVDPAQPPHPPLSKHPHDTHHGETCASGWSAPDEEGRPAGIITATSPKGNTYTGIVKFIRVEGLVDAWGVLVHDGGTKPDINFKAELVFAPTDTDVAVACAVTHNTGSDTDPKINTASLAGEAVIW